MRLTTTEIYTHVSIKKLKEIGLKLLIDMYLSPAWVSALKQAGHDAPSLVRIGSL